MGEPERYYSDFDISHEELYARLEQLKAENYHLKRQLRNKNNIEKGHKNTIKVLSKKVKKKRGSKGYRNGQKRGSNGFNG